MSEQTADGARSCARCGAGLSPGRFCTNCGARIGERNDAAIDEILPVAGADRGAPPPARSAMERLARWRSAIVVTPLVVGLLVSGGVGARMLWAQMPTADVSPETAKVICWDGLVRVRPECTLPSGEAGLRYVFPSFRRGASSCRDVSGDRPESRRPEVWQCRERARGANVTITYSEFTTVAAARRHHERVYGGPGAGTDDEGAPRFVWRSPGRGGADAERAWMYENFPYAVSVRAPTRRIVDRALRTRVDFRPGSDVKTQPVS